MSGPGGGSFSDRVYKSLYDGEDYVPWGSAPSNTRHKKPEQSFGFTGNPTWCRSQPLPGYRTHSGYTPWSRNHPLHNNAQSFELSNSDSGSLVNHNIKLQWEQRAMEFEFSMTGSRKMTFDRINNESQSSETGITNYPTWDGEGSMNTTENCSPLSQEDCLLPSIQRSERELCWNGADERQQQTMASLDADNPWGFNSFYNGSENSHEITNQPDKGPTLRNGIDESYNAIPDERGFSRTTGSPIPTEEENSYLRDKKRRPSVSHNMHNTTQNNKNKEEPVELPSKRTEKNRPPSPWPEEVSIDSTPRSTEEKVCSCETKTVHSNSSFKSKEKDKSTASRLQAKEKDELNRRESKTIETVSPKKSCLRQPKQRKRTSGDQEDEPVQKTKDKGKRRCVTFLIDT